MSSLYQGYVCLFDNFVCITCVYPLSLPIIYIKQLVCMPWIFCLNKYSLRIPRVGICNELQMSFFSNIRSNNSTCDAGRFDPKAFVNCEVCDRDLQVGNILHHMLNYCYVCCSKMTFAVYSERSMSLYKII